MCCSALKWHFSQLEDEDDRGINHTRGLACELVAWRFVTHLTEREAIEYLCYELPPSNGSTENANGSTWPLDEENAQPTERSPLLDGAEDLDATFDEDAAAANRTAADLSEVSFASTFATLNSLEIAAVADAKKFLSQKAMQRTIDGIWRGDIVFWDSLGMSSTKQARIYNKSKADPYSRLKVPLYLKSFEVAFFAAFLAFYYIVLVEKKDNVTAAEIMLYIWLASFTYNGRLPSRAWPDDLRVGWLTALRKSWSSSWTLVRHSTPQTSGLCGTLPSSLPAWRSSSHEWSVSRSTTCT